MKYKAIIPLLSLTVFFTILSSFTTHYKIHFKSKTMNEENALTMKTLLDNSYYLKGRKELYLYVNLNAIKAPVKTERKPLNISVVLDRSGSMSGDKIKYAKEACKFVVDNLEPNDNFSIVIYDDMVEVLFKSGNVKDKAALKRLIDGVHERASTNLSGGMLEGYAQVKSTYNKNNVNRVLILSDGLANRGITDEKILQQLVKQKLSEDNITLSAFGVGADFNEVLMTNLAEYGSGNYYFINSPDKIPSIFAQELKGLISVVAQNTHLNIKFPSQNLSVNKIFGINGEVKNNEISFDLKDIFSEEQKAILIKFNINQPIQEEILFESILSFDDAFTFKRSTITEKNVLKVTTDQHEFDNSFNKEVLQNIVLFENNERLEHAMLEVDKGDYEGAKKIIINIKTEMTVQMRQLPDNKELKRQLEAVSEYEKQVENAKNMSTEDRLMMQKANRSVNYSIRKKK